MRIIADVDTGIDDALALVAVAAHVDAELVGVTTTTGNTTSHLAARNSAAVLSLVGRDDVPVLVGSSKPLEVPVATTPETHGEFGLGYSTAPEAITGPFSEHGIEELWLPELREHPGQTTLLVTGPLSAALTWLWFGVLAVLVLGWSTGLYRRAADLSRPVGGTPQTDP